MTIDELNALAALTAADEVPVWDSEESGEPTKKITASNLAASVKSLADLPNTTEMNDAIQQSTAESAWKAPSAFVSYAYSATNQNGYFISTGSGGGAIFLAPPLATRMRFKILEGTYCQFGTCTDVASMPNIITTGEGRTEFNAVNQPGIYYFELEGLFAQHVFIGGDPGLIVHAPEFYVPF